MSEPLIPAAEYVRMSTEKQSFRSPTNKPSSGSTLPSPDLQ